MLHERNKSKITVTIRTQNDVSFTYIFSVNILHIVVGGKKMTDRELRKLSRAGLLEVLLTQSREIDRLRAEVAELNAKLEDRDLIMSHSGSIAEASLRINNIFEAAQKAADQYVDSVRYLYTA